MSVSWIQHRFSGGVLALDAANTVVLRGDPQRTFDRFEDVAEIAAFAEAASIYCASELGGRALTVASPGKIAPLVLAIREATDRVFRQAAETGSLCAGKLPALLNACADGLSGSSTRVGPPRTPFDDPETPIDFEVALSVSALSLLRPEMIERLKICPNCGWLFMDRSRNSSRLWCDMAVCGNRRKASRHYERRIARKETSNV